MLKIILRSAGEHERSLIRRWDVSVPKSKESENKNASTDKPSSLNMLYNMSNEKLTLPASICYKWLRDRRALSASSCCDQPRFSLALFISCPISSNISSTLLNINHLDSILQGSIDIQNTIICILRSPTAAGAVTSGSRAVLNGSGTVCGPQRPLERWPAAARRW